MDGRLWRCGAVTVAGERGCLVLEGTKASELRYDKSRCVRASEVYLLKGLVMLSSTMSTAMKALRRPLVVAA